MANRPSSPAPASGLPHGAGVSPAALALPTDAAELQNLLAAIVESSDDAILAKNVDGIIVSWNAGAQRMYGYMPEEVVGRPVSTLVPSDIENDVPMLMARLHRGERIAHYETVRRARDGKRLNVSLTISPIRDREGRIIGASTIARDITEQKREESRWRLLSDVGQALTRLLDDEEVLRTFAQLLVHEVADYCITYLVHEGGIRRVGAAHGDPARQPLVERLVELAPPRLQDEFGAGAVIRTGEPIHTPEVTEEQLAEVAGRSEYFEILRSLAPVSSIVLPLQARGRTVGAVALATTDRSMRRYGEADLVFARELAVRAALSLDNARLFGEARAELRRRQAAESSLRRRYDEIQVLYRMTEAAARGVDLDELYTLAFDGLHEGLAVERASILLFDGDGVARFRAWRGVSDAYRSAAEGYCPWPADAVDPRPSVIADAAESADLEAGLRDATLAEGIRGMAFIPLMFGGRLLGALVLYTGSPRALMHEELELARSIARTVAFALTRVRNERRVREAKEEAERANEAKSQFLGVMSHELRTPLNAVLGYAELLLLETRGPLNDEQREQLGRIQSSALHQLGLVEELLTYTRLEAGREEPRLLATDVRRVITDVAEFVRPEADSKGLTLDLDVPDAPLTLVTDPAKLRQIVLNLVGNATKYTEQGRITIRVHTRRDHLALEVRDTGPGIPADKLEYIFEPFTRVDATRTRVTAGTGLGLAIARRLAGMLGGDVAVESGIGEGSTFTLRLPLSL